MEETDILLDNIRSFLTDSSKDCITSKGVTHDVLPNTDNIIENDVIETNIQENNVIENNIREYEIPITRGLSGITNFGGTCYMNAALQVLSATTPFLSYVMHHRTKMLDDLEKNIRLKLKTDENIEDVMRNTLAYRLRLVFIRIWNDNWIIQPNKFKQAVDRYMSYFRGGSVQHDAQEFFSSLIDNIHETTKGKGNIGSLLNKKHINLYNRITSNTEKLIEAKKQKNHKKVKRLIELMTGAYSKKPEDYYFVLGYITWKNLLQNGYSVMNDIFSGMIASITKCNNCENYFHMFERQDVLPLHLPDVVDITKDKYHMTELLDLYTSEELLKDNNSYVCSYCGGKQEATKKQLLHDMPNVMVVLFKKYQKYNKQVFKSNVTIEYDHIVDFAPYTTNYYHTHEHKPINYELYAVVKHSGGYGSGHYYAYTKNIINNEWYRYDDTNVYHVNNDEPLNCNGYMLCYRRIVDNPEEMENVSINITGYNSDDTSIDVYEEFRFNLNDDYGEEDNNEEDNNDNNNDYDIDDNNNVGQEKQDEQDKHDKQIEVIDSTNDTINTSSMN